MNLIICLDNNGGYSFAGRRQSQDKIQAEKMLELVADGKLFVNEYTAKLFKELPQNLIVCTDPISQAKEDDYCFIENISLQNIVANKIIIYRWNRAYPSDKKFPQELLNGKKLVSTCDFMGNSHEKITQEVYL